VTPALSLIEGWRPEALTQLADTWSAVAASVDDAAARLRVQDGQDRGAAARAAMTALHRRLHEARVFAQRLGAAGQSVRSGCIRLAAACGELTAVLREVRDSGYVVDDAGVVTPSVPSREIDARAAEFTARVQTVLRRVAEVDEGVAAALRTALDAPPKSPAGAPRTAPTATDIVAAWPTMGQDAIAAQIAAMTPEQRAALVASAPRQVGNTDGVPWDMRIEANRLNIADALAAQQRIVDRPDDVKIREALAQGFGTGAALSLGAGTSPAARERLRATVYADPALRAAAIAYHDRDAKRHIEFYRGLLAPVPDPTARTPDRVERQVLAFDPARSSLIELHGDLRTVRSMAVLVPGLNTTILDSAANTRTARRFVAAGAGEVAMITYLGGPFPVGEYAEGVLDAASARYALDMAPRLVAFSEDVDRTVDATGRHIPVTYLGHSYGGSILGTAERMGLTADRTVYVAAAGAGVGVEDESDWHNRNPSVERYSMTAPGDWIEAVQGHALSPHGADPDEMRGVWRLPTGRRLDGSVMWGPNAHSDIVNEPSDAWHNLLAVITGRSLPR
jgi:hypothetical protein